MNDTIKLEKTNNITTYLIIKRLLDILFGLIGIIILIPLSIIIKIVSLLTLDFNSIFFLQERIGQNGKKFNMLKYRTMVPNADKILDKMLKEDKNAKEEYSKYKKLLNDPRITKVGKILRITSLDEFPQFINIFLGQMSLVGPRPYLLRERKDMGKYYKTIIKAKPGLTGYWQVNGRNNIDFKERLILEDKYIKIRNLKLDIKIVFKTVISVIKKDGAI